MLGLVNNYRARSGVGPLAASLSLDRAALWKSADMAVNRYFSHDDLGRGWQQRFNDCGYGTAADGENIAEGHPDAAQTFEQWRTSPPHNANLLNPSYHAIGVGRAEAPGGDWYWTADFGAAVDADSAAPAAVLSPPTSPPPPPPLPSAQLTAATSANAGSFAPWVLPALPASRGTIALGSTVVSNTPGDCLRAHTSPSLSSPTPVCLPDGSPLFLIDGPVTADGHTWWSVFGAGWVASDYLKPSP